MLLVHITIALLSLAVTTLAVFAPSRTKLYAGGGLVALTLFSGTILVLSTHSPLLSACLSGLAYLTVAATGLTAARHRLATQER